MGVLTEAQLRLLIAVHANGVSPMRVVHGGRVAVDGRLYPLADLYVLRARKLVRRRTEAVRPPAGLCLHETTEVCRRVVAHLQRSAGPL